MAAAGEKPMALTLSKERAEIAPGPFLSLPCLIAAQLCSCVTSTQPPSDVFLASEASSVAGWVWASSLNASTVISPV
jgi:hypothetical protein